MTDKECITQIEIVVREYFDTDAPQSHMEKIIDILETYNREATFK